MGIEKPVLSIFEQVEPSPPPQARFKIVEVVLTIDGFRSRLCNNAFATIEKAREYVKDFYDEP